MLCPDCHQPVSAGILPAAQTQTRERLRDGGTLVLDYCGCGRVTRATSSHPGYVPGPDGTVPVLEAQFAKPVDWHGVHGPAERWSL